MAFFTREILKDYGSVCAKIGDYLSLKNCSTIQEISKGTNMDIPLIHLGLSILLQRRMVSYTIYEKKTFYKLDKEMVSRRLFFNLYIRYVVDRFECHKSFLKILVFGISRISNYKENLSTLIQLGLVKEISRKDIKLENESGGSKRQDLKMFYIVDFDVLDRLIMDIYIMEYLSGRYSNSMKEIYKSICKSSIIDSPAVLRNLETTKILIKDGISYLNDVSNISEYLKYLSNLGIIKKDFDGEAHYKKKLEKALDLIKINELNSILVDDGSKRLLRMFYDLESLSDSEIVKKSLLPSSEVKTSIFKLHKYGCINLEYPTEAGKHPNIWRFNSQEYAKAITKVLEDVLSETLLSINDTWETGNIFENESFLIDISKVHYLSEKYFLLSRKF